MERVHQIYFFLLFHNSRKITMCHLPFAGAYFAGKDIRVYVYMKDPLIFDKELSPKISRTYVETPVYVTLLINSPCILILIYLHFSIIGFSGKLKLAPPRISAPCLFVGTVAYINYCISDVHIKLSSNMLSNT